MKDPRTVDFPPSSSGKDLNGHSLRKRKIELYEERPTFERLSLPIDQVKLQIIELLRENEISIIIGETGSGKSTQIPQLCIQAGLAEKGMIAVTQPRRVAAISLANRVSQEQCTEIGDTVGYRVRFENVSSSNTKIVFMTDGMLLQEGIQDAFLKKFSVIIIDEAHERSLHTDVLLSVVRQVQRVNSKREYPLKIVIMSATMQADIFSNYFNNAPVYVVQGRTFPIDLYHAVSVKPDDYVYNSIICVKDVHLSRPITDDILVFLTGREEIEFAVKKVKEINAEMKHKLHPVPLYSALPPKTQMAVFQPAPCGERKVVFATNIAETSVTIPGIRVVIDSGKVKMRTFTASDRIEVLRVQDISKAQATQRAGRAGREAPGVCYRLYSESHHDSLPETTVPEILRSNLSGVFLDLMEMGLKKPHKMKLVDSPTPSLIEAAERELIALNAVSLTGKNHDGPIYQLTEEGCVLSKFPLMPDYSKVLLVASHLGCLEEALWIISALSADSIYIADIKGSKEDVERARAKFSTNEGDHIKLLNICRTFNQEKKRDYHKWCLDNFLNARNLSNVAKIRKQLLEICRQQKLNVVSCGANKDKVRQALAAGLFLNVCEYDRAEDKYRLICQPKTLLKIHPSSCLARSRPRHIVFTDLMRTTDLYAQSVSLIDYEWARTAIEKYKKSNTK